MFNNYFFLFSFFLIQIYTCAWCILDSIKYGVRFECQHSKPLVIMDNSLMYINKSINYANFVGSTNLSTYMIIDLASIDIIANFAFKYLKFPWYLNCILDRWSIRPWWSIRPMVFPKISFSKIKQYCRQGRPWARARWSLVQGL